MIDSKGQFAAILRYLQSYMYEYNKTHQYANMPVFLVEPNEYTSNALVNRPTVTPIA